MRVAGSTRTASHLPAEVADTKTIASESSEDNRKETEKKETEKEKGEVEEEEGESLT